jgi:structural maintenance of chromosome 2
MYIEEIVVDGFKSYAQRTAVPNFDPFFNAITGLNGSGKSNILDSICFVLGITNLSQARARGVRARAHNHTSRSRARAFLF